MNYIDEIAWVLWNRLSPQDGDLPPGYTPLLRLYALLALTTGTATTLENVHDAWAVWRAGTEPGHHHLVPFQQLDLAVQERDRRYMTAIHEVAANIKH
jgi:hypothetical protein